MTSFSHASSSPALARCTNKESVLYFFQELKQREIAELLHIKLSLVKYRIGRAKELLMKELEVKKDEEL